MSVKICILFQLAGVFAVAPAALAQTQAIPFFDDSVVQQINLTVGASDWASLLQNYQAEHLLQRVVYLERHSRGGGYPPTWRWKPEWDKTQSGHKLRLLL
jgi:hypothetical protein